MSSKRALDDTVEEEVKDNTTSGVKKLRISENQNTITKEEVALYDRQIRLWGLDAQQRMRNAKVLIAGVNGLTNEICKNIVLAGVGMVTVIDPGMAKAEDLGAQFFLREDDIAKSKAEAARRQMHELNPRVNLKSIVADITSQSDDFLAEFNIVCLSGYDRKTLVRINNVCRAKRIKFWATGCAGFHGYIFSDLVEHTYTTTEQKSAEVKETKTHTTNFVSLETVLSTPWEKLESLRKREVKNTQHRDYFGFGLLWHFWEAKGRLPDPNIKTDADELVTMKDAYMAGIKADPSLLPEEIVRAFAQTARAEISPVCAVVGGVVGADILKVLGGKGHVINNFYVYDAFEPGGTIYTLPPPAFAKLKEKAPVDAVESFVIDD
ncbi:hypothetical protein HK097_003449 [Rhizophlyctis rosea]|uniref:THIF-type NAD/FAD binding fold domain-containing protein n=1 Tax=Rhizophlyctis rosea TaxID=64517 RepID=A0AAD5SEW4_9FUNG|nr:hypothetical protein HK097_003449 [Rhizophlyctis rosea]